MLEMQDSYAYDRCGTQGRQSQRVQMVNRSQLGLPKMFSAQILTHPTEFHRNPDERCAGRKGKGTCVVGHVAPILRLKGGGGGGAFGEVGLARGGCRGLYDLVRQRHVGRHLDVLGKRENSM